MKFGGIVRRKEVRRFCYNYWSCFKRPLPCTLTCFLLLFLFLFYTTLNSSSTRYRVRDIANLANKERSLPYPVTIATAYFDFSSGNRSKHALSDYYKWHQNFFPVVSTPMVNFTQSSQFSRISALRNGKPTKFHIFEEIWDLPWISEERPTLRQIYEKQNKIDPEWSYHSPELYAVWNSKAWMASYAAETNPFNSTFFFWVDSGAAREDMSNILQNFPEIEKVEQVFSQKEDASKLQMFTVEKFRGGRWKQGEDYAFGEKRVKDMIDGGFFGGRKDAVVSYASDFYALHDALIERGKFVGKDQDLYNRLAFQWPERYLVVCSCEENLLLLVLGICSDWMYYLSWYGAMENNYCDKVKIKGMTEFLAN